MAQVKSEILQLIYDACGQRKIREISFDSTSINYLFKKTTNKDIIDLVNVLKANNCDLANHIWSLWQSCCRSQQYMLLIFEEATKDNDRIKEFWDVGFQTTVITPADCNDLDTSIKCWVDTLNALDEIPHLIGIFYMGTITGEDSDKLNFKIKFKDTFHAAEKIGRYINSCEMPKFAQVYKLFFCYRKKVFYDEGPSETPEISIAQPQRIVVPLHSRLLFCGVQLTSLADLTLPFQWLTEQGVNSGQCSLEKALEALGKRVPCQTYRNGLDKEIFLTPPTNSLAQG